MAPVSARIPAHPTVFRSVIDTTIRRICAEWSHSRKETDHACDSQIGAIALALAIAATGCGAPPAVDRTAALGRRRQQARQMGRGQYAAESLKAAQDARAALDAELAVQEAKWFKLYDKAKELLPLPGRPAVAEAIAAKEQADAIAAREKRRPVARRRPRPPRSASGARLKAPTNILHVRPGTVRCQDGAHCRGGHRRSHDWS